MPSKLKKRGENSWLLTVSHQGVDFTKTIRVKSKLEAERAWNLFSARVINGEIISKKEGDMTINQFYRYWTLNHAEPNLEDNTLALTDSIYIRIGAALGELKLSEVRARHILDFMAQLRSPTASIDDKPLSTGYIKRHIETLNSMFQCAVDWDFIATNPVEKVTMPKRTKSTKELPTEKDLAKFFQSLEHHSNIKHNLWILLAFTLGLRRQEIFGIQWGDIDFKNKILFINRAVVYTTKKGIVVKSTKTENGLRALPLNKTLVAFLYSWKLAVVDEYNKKKAKGKITSDENPVEDKNFIFTKKNGTVAHPHSFNTFLRKYCEERNIPVISPHDLRHMYGSYLLAGGVNLATVSSLLGHANKAFTLQTYIHELKSVEHQSADIISDAVEKIKILEK